MISHNAMPYSRWKQFENYTPWDDTYLYSLQGEK